LSAVAFTLWRWLAVWWPLLVVAVALALTAGALLAVVVHRARRTALVSARWVEIVPPATMPRDNAVALWHALAGMLRRTARRGFAPRHLAVEFVGDADGIRAGVWVPPALALGPVRDAVAHVWPGARLRTDATPPRWSLEPGATGQRVSAAEIYPVGGPWVPLVDGGRSARAVEVGDADPLRGALWTLARLGDGERACVQLIVTPERGVTGERGGLWWARLLTGGLRLVGRAVLAVVDVFLPGPTRGNAPTVHTAHTHAEDNPAADARRRAIATKQGLGPHLRATLRVAYSGPGTRRAHRHTLDTLAGAFDLAAPLASLRTHRTRRAAGRLDGRRHARTRHSFAATVGELAALWHLPEEPTQYGMADTVTRVRSAGRSLPRIPRNRRAPGTQGGHDAAA
jgi:hypothetical protein